MLPPILYPAKMSLKYISYKCILQHVSTQRPFLKIRHLYGYWYETIPKKIQNNVYSMLSFVKKKIPGKVFLNALTTSEQMYKRSREAEGQGCKGDLLFNANPFMLLNFVLYAYIIYLKNIQHAVNILLQTFHQQAHNKQQSF